MATIPRYQRMGVQYADLPRLSTAGLEQAAKGFDVLSEKLDRMTSYFQERATTEVKKEAQKYAFENPLTKEQVDVALGTREGLQVPGAGRIFQETYEKVQAHQLSTELQMEGQRKIASVSAAIESGAPVDLNSIHAEIKDMIDGYTASVMALDPERALQMKASLSTVGNTLYQKAAAQALKQHKEQVQTNVNLAIDSMPKILENIIEAAGSIDPSTGKEINIDALIEVAGKPFLDVVPLLGDKPYKDYLGLVKDAKINALVRKGTDRDFNKSPSDAIAALNSGNFGKLTGVYGGLTQEEKEKIHIRVLKSYSDEYRIGEEQKKADKEDKKQKAAQLNIEFLNQDTSPQRKRQIVDELVLLDDITLSQSVALLKPPTTSDSDRKNPVLFGQIHDQIVRGIITSPGQLIEHKDNLSDAQYQSLAVSVTNTQGKNALDLIKRRAGIRDNQFIPEDKFAKQDGMLTIYHRNMAMKITDSSGVQRYMTPMEAANAAIVEFEGSKAAKEQLEAQENAKTKIFDILGKKGVVYQGDLYNLDINSLRGLSNSDKENLRGPLNAYKRSIDEMRGK